MDFFEYATIALQFVNAEKIYIPFVVGGLCFLIVFVFQAIGLYTIAKRENLKNKWMAFVPFFNTYYIGVCGQKNRTFKSIDTKLIALIAAILEAVLFCGYVVYYVAQVELGNAGCIHGVTQEGYYGLSIVEYQLYGVPDNLLWAAWCFECLYDYILVWLDLLFLVMQVFILSAFFQTYSARRYFLFTIVSVLFPVQGIIIFIIRNNTGMNYREFIRREQERQYRIYQQYSRQNPDSNLYNQNPYSNGYNGYNPPPAGGSRQTADPFSEYGNQDGASGNADDDPFDL